MANNVLRIIVRLAEAAVLSGVGTAFGADWPQFMGPNGDGTSPEKGLARTWPESGPKVLWTVPVGKGYGNGAIRDGKLYVLDRADQQRDVLRCLDLETGKEEWNFAYEAPGAISHDGSRSTPAVSPKHVFTIGPFGHLHCLDRATHRVVWKKNLIEEYDAQAPRWAVAQSPLLYRDTVIVGPQSARAGLVALDQSSGKEVWRSSALGDMAYASPRLVTLDGVDQIAILNPKGVYAVSASDGQSLWDYPHPCKIPIPNVSVLGRGKLFVTGGYNAGSAIIEVTRAGSRWTARNVAGIDGIGAHCHPGLVYRDHIYVLCNTNERNDGLVCFDYEGKVVWQTKRDPYLCKGGSILTSDGLIYLMDGAKGELHIIEPSPAGFKSLAQAKLLEGREIWGPLALSDGRLLVRDQSQMKCVDLRPNP